MRAVAMSQNHEGKGKDRKYAGGSELHSRTVQRMVDKEREERGKVGEVGSRDETCRAGKKVVDILTND